MRGPARWGTGPLLVAGHGLWHNALGPSMRTLVPRFLLGLIIGVGFGLLYGWVIQPVEYVDTTPDSLRADYRADYVLMVAEAYAGDGDVALAQVRLAALGPQPPAELVVEAIEYGIDHNFSRADLETLNRLALTLRSLAPTPEIGSP